MNLSITVTGPPRQDGSQMRSGVDLQIDVFDDRTVSRIADAARQCHQALHNAAEPVSNNRSDGQRRQGNGTPRLATEKQVRAIHAMADRQGLDLAGQLQDRFSVSSVKALSIQEASRLIDELKSNLQSA
ncbi:hypothetical protein [Roseiconus lacunae]|uniref:Uncharacterized protein n=1 Tax=Roseiconus lacunae TaxID=2605694 RepID=A0ABT7PNS9_9BACT|nr:hypothetical protein [Roseiconus lacunae]MDM4018163.1 hypothetical protein [Roseiconus lacunae]